MSRGEICSLDICHGIAELATLGVREARGNVGEGGVSVLLVVGGHLGPRVEEGPADVIADAHGEIEVLGLEGDPLGVDGTEHGVFEEACNVGFGDPLDGVDGMAFEASGGELELAAFTDEAGEGPLAHERGGAFLVLFDLAEGDGARTVAVLGLDAAGRLDAAGGGGGDDLAELAGAELALGDLLGAGHGGVAGWPEREHI